MKEKPLPSPSKKLDYAAAPASRRPGYLERVARGVAEMAVEGIFAIILMVGAIAVAIATATHWLLCFLSTASFLVVMAGVWWAFKRFLHR